MGRARHILGVLAALLWLLPTWTIGQTILELAVPDAGSASHDNKASELVRMKPGYSFKPDAGSGNMMHAFIDPSIINETDYADLYSSGGSEPWPPQIDQAKAVGFTPGSHSVTPTGAAAYDIPIQLPPGTAGMVPSLSISYNSQSGNGQLGMGWNIAGLSAITRVPNTIYHNTAVKGVKLDHTDVFALDGNRLIRVSGAIYGQDGCVYGTEQETFSRIVSHGYYGEPDGSATDGGPEWFEVRTKEGMILHFGNSEDSRFWTGDGSKVIVHRINKMIDQYGNYVTFKYRNIDRQSVIEEIRYTGNDNANVQPYNVIQFEYDERQDKNTVYVNGFYSDVNSNLLLRKIRIIADGQHFKNYEFEYGLNLFSFLKSVTESGSNGDELNSTLFRYGEEVEELVVEEFPLVAIDAVRFFPGDYNGDGLTDVVAATKSLSFYTNLKLHLNTGSGFLTGSGNGQNLPPFTAAYLDDNTYHHRQFAGGDFDGNGTSDLLMLTLDNDNQPFSTINSLKIFSYVAGSGFYSTNYQMNTGEFDMFTHTANHFFTGDFDGDGTLDIMIFLSNGLYLQGFIMYPRYNSTTFYPITEFNALNSNVSFVNMDDYQVIDHDGDGKHDLLMVKDSNSEIFSFTRVGISVTASSIRSSEGFPTRWHNIFTGDFNGDGKTDLLTKTSEDDWYVNYSDGAQFYSSQPFTFDVNPSTLDIEFGELAVERVVLGDYNGDGKTDILHQRNTSNMETVFSVYYADGKLFHLRDYLYGGTFLNQGPFVQDYPLLLNPIAGGDFFGDGKVSLIRNKPGVNNVEIFSFKRESTEFLLAQAVNGIGNSVEFQYTTLAQENPYPPLLDNPPNNYPINYFKGSLSIVKQIVTPDGIGGQTTSIFNFWHPKIHKEGKGFLGFALTRVETDPSIHVTTYYSFNETYFAFVPKLELRSGPNAGNSTWTYNWISPDNIRYLPQLSSSLVNSNVTYATTSTTYESYDPFGNATKIVTETGPERTEVNMVYTTFANWHVPSRVESVLTKVRRNNGPDFPRKVSYTYNSQGSVHIETVDPTKPKSVVTTHGYNVFGNLQSTVTSAAEVPTRTSSYEYDPKGRFAIRSTNTLGQHAYATFDNRWGEPLSVTDISGHVNTFVYDGFGRQKQAIDPLGISATVSLHWDISGLGGTIYRTETQAPGRPTGKVWHDAFGRERKRQTQGFGQQTVTTLQTYDYKGRAATSIGPHSSGSGLETSYDYDPYNRPQTVTTPIGPITYGYAASGGQLTNTVTAPGQPSKNKVMDATGKVISSTDDGGTLEFDYHPSGNLERTSYGDNSPVSMEYDIYGRQSILTDLNSGPSAYEYDAFGQLKQQVDANNHLHQMEYDALGRITKREGPDGTVTYHYVTQGNGLNQVKKVSLDNGTMQEYTYDDYNRVASFKETVSGKEFTTSYTYDEYGRAASVTYPSGFIITYGYDANGYMTTVNSGDTDIFTAEAANAFGQLTQYTLGNGKTTTRGYSTLGIPENIITSNVLEHRYDFIPATGNLDKRTDDRRSLIENFQYDGLQRLRSAEVAGAATPAEVEYFDNGNIREKTDAGLYTYLDDKINAVKTITNPDVNISQTPQMLTYTEYGRKTASIFEGLHFATFTYGPDNERKKMTLTGGEYDVVRYYHGNYEELHLTDEYDETDIYRIHYIGGGDGLCAIHVMVNDEIEGQTYYVYKDYLGSILALTDDEGNIEGEQSFDAWGRYRDPATWEVLNSDPADGLLAVDMPLWFGRGYTGHEHLREFDLINMNGRMYDPLQGRMLAPDNFVQDPFGTQTYNRYSYAHNNPLKYTDPDGENPAIIAAIVIGVVVNVAVNAAMGNIDDFGDFLCYAVIGGAAGAAGGAVGGAVAGALGTATTLGGAIANGVMAGAAGGFTSGLITGSGNSWTGGASLGNGLLDGLKTGGIGAAVGGLLGGISGGIKFSHQMGAFRSGLKSLAINERDVVPKTDDFVRKALKVWYPDAPTKNLDAFTVEAVPDENLASMKAVGAAGQTVPSRISGMLTGNSSVYFNGDLAFDNAKRLFHTIGHELVHVSQFSTLAGQAYPSNLVMEMMEFHAYSYEWSLGSSNSGGFNIGHAIGFDSQSPAMFQSLNYINFNWTGNHNFVWPIP